MSGHRLLGRTAFRRRSWTQAHAHLAGILDDDDADAEDLELLAVTTYMLGRNEESRRAWERAHLASLGVGDKAGAAMRGFWLGLTLMMTGETARASGWLARTARLAEEAGQDCSAHGYLLIPQGLQAIESGDLAQATEVHDRALAVARECGDADLMALAQLGQGITQVALGDVARGKALLDEVMVAVVAGEVSPIPAGIIYCAVIVACMQLQDLARAAEWTEALGTWCETQPDLVPYRGQCLIHRSQVLTLQGSWSRAAEEIGAACEHLAQPPHAALGEAHYQRAELLRLQGRLEEAEAGYRLASEHGRDPVPGLARLRLAQGRLDEATATIHRAVEEVQDPLARCDLLVALVEVMVAGHQVEPARRAADQLDELASRTEAAMTQALAARAMGSVHLAKGDPRVALSHLRRAAAAFMDLGVPYETARTRVLVARACHDLGDGEASRMEAAAARAVFERLGAALDLAELEAGLARPPAPTDGLLTGRERQVLRLLATGRTNRAIATDLVISEHTVARHVQNIFNKLGVSSRAAATAWAYERGVV